jgi:hypothetical protein
MVTNGHISDLIQKSVEMLLILHAIAGKSIYACADNNPHWVALGIFNIKPDLTTFHICLKL